MSKRRRLGRPEDSINLPFEPSGGELLDKDGRLASGVVVMAATIPVPEVGPCPALVFRFANPDGSGFYPPMALVTDAADMRKLTSLVGSAVTAAIKAAES